MKQLRFFSAKVRYAPDYTFKKNMARDPHAVSVDRGFSTSPINNISDVEKLSSIKGINACIWNILHKLQINFIGI